MAGQARNPRWLPSSILCPVDFSKPSARALRNAVFLARNFEAQLTVLTVVPPVSTLYGWLGREKEAVQRRRRTIISAPSTIFSGSSIFTAFRGTSWFGMGRPIVEILAAAADTQADLIVMGSVGRTGLSRILLGSVAERVLQAVPCSMLLVKAEDTFRLQVDRPGGRHREPLPARRGTAAGRDSPRKRGGNSSIACRPTSCLSRAGKRLPTAVNGSVKPLVPRNAGPRRNRVRDTLSWRQVEADIRSKHPFWRRGTLTYQIPRYTPSPHTLTGEQFDARSRRFP